MELQEQNTRKQSCYEIWHNIPERIVKQAEYFFYQLGTSIAQSPLKWMLGCSVIMLSCILGLLRFQQEKNPLKLWVPPNSDFVSDTEWLMSHFKEGLRMETFILTGGNVLEQQALIKLNEITKQMISTQTPDKKTSWTDVCMKIPTISGYTHRQKRQSFRLDDFFDDDFISKINETSYEPIVTMDPKFYCNLFNSLPKVCLIFSILDIWDFDSSEIAKDSAEEIITKINTVKISPTFGHPVNFSEFLGDITLDERGRIVAATAVKTEMIVHVNFLNVDMDMGNNAGTADWATNDVLEWESTFLKTLEMFSNKLQNDRNEKSSLMLYYEAGRSFGDITESSIFQEIDKLAVGFMIMFFYILMIVSNLNWVELQFCLVNIGLLCVGTAFLMAVGICSLMGIRYGPIHTSLPFLLLGLGTDDLFVFMASWKLIHTDESNLHKPLQEKIGLTLAHAGSAITVTSLTDVVAFLVGASTILPSLQSFCIYAAVGIFVTYLLQITFFTAYFTLDAKRIEKKRNGILPCIVHENFIPKLSNPSNSFSYRFINAIYSRVILTTTGKVIVIIITIVLASISVVGSLQLEQWFDPLWLVSKQSHLNQYYDIKYQKYPNRGHQAFVLMRDDIDYPSEFPKIVSLTEHLENASFIQSIEPWPSNFVKFMSTYYNTDLMTTKLTHDDFYYYLSKFLFSRAGGRYQRNFFFNGTLACGESTPQIIIATIDFHFKRLRTPHEWIPAMDDSKRIVAELPIHGHITVWCKMFGPWTTDKLIAQEVLRNVILALVCVMATTAVLIAELQTCCWILLCVVLTLLDVCGFIYFWGLTIDLVSCIGLELAIGLCVDYAAHVAHAFLKAESRSNDGQNARTARALIAVRHIGAAVAFGGGSTLLPLMVVAFSTSYIFTSFFKIFFLVVIFGLWHGLILLPIVLSIIGPRSVHTTQRRPMSEKSTMADN